MRLAALRAALLSGVVACGPSSSAARAKSAGEPPKKVHVAYEVRAHERGAVDVALTLERGAPLTVGVDDGMDAFVSDLTVGDARVAAPRWDLSSIELDGAACASGCTVRYHFDLEAAARSGHDADSATEDDGMFVTCPSAWLLRPAHAGDDATFDLTVDVDPSVDFAFGAPADASSKRVFRGSLGDLDQPPYAAVGAFHRLAIDEAPGLEVVVGGAAPAMGDAGLTRWISEAVKNLRTIYPGYPRHHAMLAVLVEKGARVGPGTAMGNGGASIEVHIGERATEEETNDDWILTHEMFHLAFPGLARTHHWAEEGMATYLEPIARARRGVIPVTDVWREWLHSMHLGEPFEDDQGLDQTASWGRTYWGGALFWFVSDVEVRKATANVHGAPDLFAAIYRQADIAERWPMSRVIEVTDQAAGGDAIAKLYATHATHPVKVDLDKLFRDLGVSERDGKITLDDGAPLAAVRRAIVTGPSKP